MRLVAAMDDLGVLSSVFGARQDLQIDWDVQATHEFRPKWDDVVNLVRHPCVDRKLRGSPIYFRYCH
jgi:hypothetical protein